jgi:hypothetical protein
LPASPRLRINFALLMRRFTASTDDNSLCAQLSCRSSAGDPLVFCSDICPIEFSSIFQVKRSQTGRYSMYHPIYVC